MTEENNQMQEMQVLEQNLHNLMLQKQTFQIELSETKSALGEIEKTSDDVFKLIGQLMIRSEKSKIKEELLNKQKILDLRINAIQKQENSLGQRAEDLREKLMKNMKK
jgi:prefoldin beta subunit